MKKKFWIKTRIFLWFWIFVIIFTNVFLYLLYLWFEKSFFSSVEKNISTSFEMVTKSIDKNENWIITNISNEDIEKIKELWLFMFISKNDEEIKQNYKLGNFLYWEKIIFRWDYKWYNIIIWKNIFDFLNLKWRLFEIVLLADLIWFFIIIMMTYLITNTLLKPLIVLSKEISNYDISKNKEPLKNNFWNSEIGLITKSINNLINKSKNILESQKRFIQDSNHELKTPLMQIDTNIEIIEEKISDEKILQKLENVKKSTENMNKIVSNLGFILRDEKDNINLEKINLWEYFEKFVKSFEEDAKKKNISIKIFKNFDLEIENNFYFLDRLFWNLIQNSIFYNNWNNEIKIEIFKDKVILKDEWIWLKTEEVEKIFDRFYRNSNSTIYNKWWNWLGLTIVKKICDDFNWEIKVKSEIWKWTEFEIIF